MCALYISYSFNYYYFSLQAVFQMNLGQPVSPLGSLPCCHPPNNQCQSNEGNIKHSP